MLSAPVPPRLEQVRNPSRPAGSDIHDDIGNPGAVIRRLNRGNAAVPPSALNYDDVKIGRNMKASLIGRWFAYQGRFANG